eukprot:TRINITY_DN9864_c0_g1_i3.p1 TRINITY_DN9864_c0_g1~~TRINITY_DN9864_c0_g1_i3.p1  ORF type:complete len:106 (-),score=11.85 TRINITY_DN9864_c0_g1_i3:40-357(-)
MGNKVQSRIHVLHFNTEAQIVGNLSDAHSESKYAYHIHYKGNDYLLKGIYVAPNLEEEKSMNSLSGDVLISYEMYEEYYFMKAVSSFSPHSVSYTHLTLPTICSV